MSAMIDCEPCQIFRLFTVGMLGRAALWDMPGHEVNRINCFDHYIPKILVDKLESILVSSTKSFCLKPLSFLS